MDPINQSLLEHMTEVMENKFEMEMECIYLTVSEQTMMEWFMRQGRTLENKLRYIRIVTVGIDT